MAGKLATSSGKGPQVNSDPNVIPFIDIMLVMLIIFMVAAPPPTVDIKVDLPPPGPQQVIETQDKPTTVTLLEQGGRQLVYVGSTEVNGGNFETELLRIAAQNNPTKAGNLSGLFVDAKIFVDADQTTAYDNVIGLINQIDRTGFKKVSLLVKSAAG
jgi:biopolymer transport protein ExbD